MTGPGEPMKFERTIEVPPNAVFDAFTSSLAMKEWFGDEARVDGRAGGRVYLYWRTGYCTSGAFTSLEPDRRLTFTWRGPGEPAASRVDVALEPVRGGVATRVAVEHHDLGHGEDWAEARAAIETAWANGLENLASVLEEGADLRLYGRPMLGLAGGAEVTPELAADRGLPVEAGLLMTDFVDGMGAANAGMERGDLLVRLADTDVTDWDSLARAVAARDVGDIVPVVVFRGDQRLELPVTLLGRPRIEPPASATEAAELLRDVSAETHGRLEALLEGVPERLLTRTPSYGGWSVKHTLAHLVGTERALHMWLTLRLNGEDSEAWLSDEDILVESLASLYPTSRALLDELRRAKDQTVAMVAALPQDFLERRGSYVMMCDTLFTALPYHARVHIEQIAEAIADGGTETGSEG